MKKCLLLAALFSAIILTTFSCRKSFDSEPIQKSNYRSVDMTEQKVMNFLNANHDFLKDEQVYSTDSAIWYAEAALNFTYSIYDSSFMYIMIDTTWFSFELDENHEVTQTELEAVYADMVDTVGEYFDVLQDNIKHLFYCDVEEIGVEGDFLEVTLYTVIACGYSGYQWSSFDEDDYWYSVLEFGKCNGYQGAGDAAIELTAAFMSPMVVADPQVRIWFSDPVTVPEVDPWYYEYLPAQHDHRGFWFYGTGSMTYPQCLDPDELEFYMSEDGISYIIDDQNPDPDDLDFESIFIHSDGVMFGTGYWVEAHLMDLTYGIKHETYVPASGL